MEVIYRETTIPPQPEKKITRTVYVASDGKEFLFKSDCELHEKQLEIQSHPVFLSRREARTFWDEYGASLYCLSSQSDYEFWISNIGTPHLRRNHWQEGYGPGWYIFYTIDGGDSDDYRYLFKLDEYINGIHDQVDEWLSEIENKIS